MKDKSMALFSGALAMFHLFSKEWKEEVHHKYGIDKVSWRSLRQDDPWDQGDLSAYRQTLQDVLEAGMTHAGLGVIDLPAEYVAVAIARCVHPSNWLVACASQRNLVDGAKVVSQQGEYTREYVTPTRLFCLVLAAHEYNVRRAGPEQTLEKQVEKAK